MTGRTAARWAWGIAAATLASQILVVWVVAANRAALPAHVVEALPILVSGLVIITAFPVLAAVILRRYPRHPIGWIMCGAAATAVLDGVARSYAIAGLYLAPGSVPAAEVAAWSSDWIWLPAVALLLLYVPLLFPDGRLPSPRWRPVAVVGAWWIVLATLGYAFVPEPLTDFPDVDKPFQVPAASALASLMLLIPVAVGVSLAAVLVRRRRSQGDEREQLRWLTWAVGVALPLWTLSMVFGVLGVGEWGIGAAAMTLGPVMLILVAITVAIVEYRLYDIDTLINRTLVYGALTAAVLAAYGIVVLAATAASPAEVEWRWSVLVVAAVAILAYPLREWLQRRVNRLMYGDRDDPARALSRLTRRLGDALTPTTLLTAAVDGVAQALRLPYVAVQLVGDPAPKAAHGTPRGRTHRVGLVHQGAPVGTLIVGERSPTERLSAADLRVLDDVAAQVAVAAHAVRLAEDLQRSRERLVLAREEERRRLRRDLHDGLGSALAGLALQAGNARATLPESPQDALRWVAPLEDGIRAAVADIRRIVDDLRPPSIDELGLAGALRERAAALHPGAVLHDEGLDGAVLPAAVEVAAYRIATEALANAVRHAGADRVDLRLSVETRPPALRVEVVDDGVGVPPEASPGVGLRSMRERAEEVGGTCAVSPAHGGGTMVVAVLPITSPQVAGDPGGGGE